MLAAPKRARHIHPMSDYILKPDPTDKRLTARISGVDHNGARQETSVVVERPLTLYLNGQEIVTMMTIGDYPDYLAVGYLLNQNMLSPKDRILGIDFDEDLNVVVVRTDHKTDFEDKLRRKTLTSGCAQGTAFGDLMERFDDVHLPGDAMPSLYLEAGAIHGCVLAKGPDPLLYMEDVGRHNAIDKIAGYMAMHDIVSADKIFYTTGRLTSEMVIKTVQMGIPILISRSGFTVWGVELARQAGLTLIGRARGHRFLALSGAERILYDADPKNVAVESSKSRRKAASA
jgi:FdhD protein